MKVFFGILIVLIGLATMLIGVVIGNDPEFVQFRIYVNSSHSNISLLEFVRLPLLRITELFGGGWLYIFGGILLVLIGVLILIVKMRNLVGAGFKRNTVNY